MRSTCTSPGRCSRTSTPRWRLTARALDHRVVAVGYRLEEAAGVTVLPDRLAEAGIAGPDVGRLLREGTLATPRGIVEAAQVTVPRPGQVFAFVMDTRPCPAAVELARGADLLVVESTFLQRDAELAARYGHLTARQAGVLARDAGARQLVLTHFSQRYGESGEPFRAEASEVFPDVVAAEDLARIPRPGAHGRRGRGQ